jgi:transcriptional regulator GlxA family with amidase domain
MAYLTGWRLRLAAQALASTSKGVADIAADVGYESEAAFNRAFKRAFGLPPARYRRERRSPTAAPGGASPVTVTGTQRA